MSLTRKEEILLGSGDVYISEFTGTLPTDLSTVKVDTNKLGEVSGGATLEYKPSYYTAKSDSGKAIKTIITDEEVTFKSGIMTFCGNTLKKICATARVTDDTTNSKRIVKIGGIANNDGKSYVIIFNHVDPEVGDTDVIIVGKNTSGFSLAFTKDKETVIDAEFKALPQDTDGTLIQYIEYEPEAD